LNKLDFLQFPGIHIFRERFGRVSSKAHLSWT
jgi:hypothetical protein